MEVGFLSSKFEKGPPEYFSIKNLMGHDLSNFEGADMRPTEPKISMAILSATWSCSFGDFIIKIAGSLHRFRPYL